MNVTIVGNFQTRLGCEADWEPNCARSLLEDVGGDGFYSLTTTALPAGRYEAKVALNGSWAENYGAGGIRNGANVGFTVHRSGERVVFRFDAHTRRLSVGGIYPGDLEHTEAHWIGHDTLAWVVPSGAARYRLFYAENGGLELAAEGLLNGQGYDLDATGGAIDELQRRNLALPPAPSGLRYTLLKLEDVDRAEIAALLKGQIAVAAFAADGRLRDATGVQIANVLDDLYSYDGPLGVSVDGKCPTIRVWAPTARALRLHLFDHAASPAGTTIPMRADPQTGVWSAAGAPDWIGKYYLFEVEVYVRRTGMIERNLVTDPYSVGLSCNSRRSLIVDLADAALAPDGWQALAKPSLAAFVDAVIYELHIRDFSANDSTVPPPLRGTYRAFTQQDSAGMRHLRALAEAGLTHIHLLPAFDFATVEENPALRSEPDSAELATFPPDSERQQTLIEAYRQSDGFNWGYDPYHYNAPEGSYATDQDGPARIREFREMVQGLAESGLRVVMDVVYNHTHAGGQDHTSVLDRIVPDYYHRLNAQGYVESSTCCANTASEHHMMEKLMIDTLITWATAYKVDGFRFDLMGHHMQRNMVKIRAALDALTLEKDGVDGRRILIYGEGWDFGEVWHNSRGINATQINLAGSGIGTFNDRMRDAVRGSGAFAAGEQLRRLGFICGLDDDPSHASAYEQAERRVNLLHLADQIRVGLAGNLRDITFVDRTGALVRGAEVDYHGSPTGYALDPKETVNYVEAHDGHTLFDLVQVQAPRTASIADRVRIHNLGLSVVALAQGIPFFHAGMDLLRSKSGDANSYDSGDWFNRLDWSYESNNWGVGLPPRQDNQASWPVLRPLLGDASLRPSRADILRCAAHFRELLRIRNSSILFRMRAAGDIVERVRFLNTGLHQAPGLIVMNIADNGRVPLDPRFARIVVLFNADVHTRWFAHETLVGGRLSLHPVQQASDDSLVSLSRYDSAAGAVSVSGRTAAVFVEERAM